MLRSGASNTRAKRGTWLDSTLTDALVKDTMRAKLRNHAEYRKHVNPISATDEDLSAANLSWQRGWPHSTTLLLQFIETVVYGRLYDSSLRAAVKAQKTVSELLETALPWKEAVGTIRKATVKAHPDTQEEASGTAVSTSSYTVFCAFNAARSEAS